MPRWAQNFDRVWAALRGGLAALRRRSAQGPPAGWARRRSASTTSRSTWSRRARTRPSPARSPPASASPWGQSVPGRRVHQRRADVLRLLPRGVLARHLRGVHRTARRGRRPDRPGRDHVPVRPPAAAQRVDAAQLAAQRRGGARHRRPPARRDLLPDPDGLAVGPGRHDSSLYDNHVIPAADFLVANGPSDGVERWEEQSGYSPSTIAAEIAGLTAAAAIAQVNHDPTARGDLPGHRGRLRAEHRELDGDDQRSVHQRVGARILHPRHKGDQSDDGPGRSRRPVRLHAQQREHDQRRSACGDRRRLPRPGPPRRAAGQRPGESSPRSPSSTTRSSARRRAAPASTATATADDGNLSETATATATSRRRLPRRPAKTRRTASTTGAPWPPTDTGTGHLWPVLNGERGEYEIAAGDFGFAGQLLTAMRNMTSGQGLEPEQVWEDPDQPASPVSAPIRPPPRSASPTASRPARPARSPGPRPPTPAWRSI